MKLISLNTWGGKLFDPLIKFIKKNSRDTDIFCFQEVFDTNSNVKQYQEDTRANLLGELKSVLANFHIFYTIAIAGFDERAQRVDFDLKMGNAIFLKNSLRILDKGELLLCGKKDEIDLKKDFSNLPIYIQYVTFLLNAKEYTISNLHGTSRPGSKLDTPIRLEQSRKITHLLKNKGSLQILAGDFNLLPETESIKMIEENMRNLIKEYEIIRTRSRLNPFFKKQDFQKYADYVFVTKDIKVESFSVPDEIASDHLPMILEFS